MIVKEYLANINCHKPRCYFERWYADVWQRRIGKPNASPGVLEPILEEELDKLGGTIDFIDNDYRFRVCFNREVDYTMFMMRWS